MTLDRRINSERDITPALEWLGAMARKGIAGGPLVLSVDRPRRSEDQSSKFHAMCGDIAKSGMEWAGKRRTKDQWKVLLISGHSVVTKRGVEIVPGLEGEFINIRESSAKMSKSRISSLIEYAAAFCAENNIQVEGD